MALALKIILLSTLLVFGKAEVYIVTVEGEPVISYTGGIDGLEATAMESDEKIDSTRYCLPAWLYPDNFILFF